MPLEPTHKPQKKRKLITHFPNGRAIPKQMQYMLSKGLVEANDDIHNALIDAMVNSEEPPMFKEMDIELYYINNAVWIYDEGINTIWYTKDTTINQIMELDPKYWEELASR